MALLLKIIKGVLEGQTYPVEHGMTIGRSRAVVALREPKVSTIHAKIKKAVNGDFYIIDNGSTNGTFVDGKKIKHCKLVPGQVIGICNSEIQVFEEGKPLPARAPAAQAVAPVQAVLPSAEPTVVATKTAAAPTKTAAPTATVAPNVVPGKTQTIAAPVVIPPPVELEPDPETWQTYISRILEKLKTRVKDRQRVIAPLSPALLLTFQTGVQAETTWTLGYGPRKIGAKSMDLPILEPGAPGLCFEVVPTPGGTLFKTVHPQKVLLNGRSVSSETLKVGDVIKIKNTEIEIGLIE